MLKMLIPDFLADKAYELTPEFFKKLGVTTIITDLDNTIDNWRNYEPCEEAKKWVKSLKDNGLRVILASNSKSDRVLEYAKHLDVEVIPFCLKPSKRKIVNYVKSNNISSNEVAMVGDQIFTDTIVANNSGYIMILVEPLSTDDDWRTFFNRRMEKPIRRKVRDRKLSRHWEEILNE